MNLRLQVLECIEKGISHRKIRDELWVPLATISKRRNEKQTPVVHNNLDEFKKYTYKDWEVEAELSALEKAVEKLSKRFWIEILINKENFSVPIRVKVEPYRWGNKDNVLVIGDCHLPYTMDGYLEFCREQQEKYDCGTVVNIGDFWDWSSISYHEKIVEELNPSGEIAQAKQMSEDWYYTFPETTILDSNHWCLPYRVARTAGLPRELIRSPNDIYNAPLWRKFVPELELHWVLYTHWTKGNALDKCVKEGVNLVQGHLHSCAWVKWTKNRNWTVFGMQVSTGIDYKRKAFDYARSCPSQPMLGCWVVLDKWVLPIFIPFPWI